MKKIISKVLNPLLSRFDLMLVDKGLECEAETLWAEGLIKHYQYEKSLLTEQPLPYKKREYPPKEFVPTNSEWEEVSNLLQDHMTVCELGPGTGRFTDLYFQRCEKLYLVDVSKLICEKILKEKYSDYQQIEVLHSTNCRMPAISDVSVDLFFGYGVFSHFDVEQFVGYLDEGSRILKPGGKIVIEYQSLSEETGWKRFLSRIPTDYSNSIFRYHSKETIETIAIRLGFHIERSILDKNGLNGSYLVLKKPQTQQKYQCILASAAENLDSTDTQTLYSETGIVQKK
jgi:ubiquinone/menaquinone biosynthesis C-methylase UbiE